MSSRVASVAMTFALLSNVTLGAAQESGLLGALMEHDVRLSEKARRPSRPSRGLIVVIDLQGEASPVNSETLGQFILTRLRKNGIEAKLAGRELRKSLFDGTASPEELFTPKLIISAEVRPSSSPGQVLTRVELSCVDYEPRPGARNRLRAVKSWEAEPESRSAGAHDIEDAVGRYVGKEIPAYARFHRAKEKEPRPEEQPLISQTLQGKAPGDSHLSYSMSWNDPDNRSHRILFGASAGTPALVNLHVGFWGGRSLPLIAGVSGMYYAADRRGVQAELGWAFDNSGSVKQAGSIVGVMFNGTRQEVSVEKDIYGAVTKTTTNTINDLHPYVGPAYTVQWQDFRLQGGAAFRMDSSSEPNVRFLIQLGYTPSWRL